MFNVGDRVKLDKDGGELDIVEFDQEAYDEDGFEIYKLSDGLWTEAKHLTLVCRAENREDK